MVRIQMKVPYTVTNCSFVTKQTPQQISMCRLTSDADSSFFVNNLFLQPVPWGVPANKVTQTAARVGSLEGLHVGE